MRYNVAMGLYMGNMSGFLLFRFSAIGRVGGSGFRVGMGALSFSFMPSLSLLNYTPEIRETFSCVDNAQIEF